jgi:hypothetical protein
MAALVKVTELNGGIPLDDPTSGTLYIVKNGLDYPIEFDTLFKYIYRGNSAETCDGTNGQVITYGEPFLNEKPAIFDALQLGIELVSWDETGFVINSVDAGTFGYLTIKTR